MPPIISLIMLMVITVYIEMVPGILNDIVPVSVQKGEKVVLKCCGSEDEWTWLGPDTNNISQIHVVYFSNNLKNPKLNQSKYLVEKNDRNYDLIILNFQNENTGVYVCRFLNNGAFHETKFNVSLKDTSPSSTIIYGEGRNTVLNTTNDWEKNATQNIEDNPCTCNSTLHNEFWKVSGGFLGGIIVCLICSNIYCYMKLKKASKDISEVQREGQYDEIGSINYNVVSIETLGDNTRYRTSVMNSSGTNIDTSSTKSPTLSYSSTNDSLSRKTEGSENTYESINLDQNHTQEHRKSAGNTIPSPCFYDIDTRSTKSTTLSFSSTNDLLSRKTDGSENTYEPINLDQNHIHEFKTCNVITTTLTSVYENTVVFPNNSYKKKDDLDNKTPWLCIYNRIEN
ncbi:uncharacterized protein LOC127718068 [Mytilus californianus]|uniref:uncharacterized protein LOC127718068 n=1 Tax=Mytilus californianus TaxID=6549 RepID=UPI002247F971|nr:uncharacterized protein LOC127718068 [Mytilus californianus]